MSMYLCNFSPLFSAAAPHIASVFSSHHSVPFAIPHSACHQGRHNDSITADYCRVRSDLLATSRWKSTCDDRKWHLNVRTVPSRRCGRFHSHMWADHTHKQLPTAFVSSIGELHHCIPHPHAVPATNNCSVLPSSSGGA